MRARHCPFTGRGFVVSFFCLLSVAHFSFRGHSTNPNYLPAFCYFFLNCSTIMNYRLSHNFGVQQEVFNRLASPHDYQFAGRETGNHSASGWYQQQLQTSAPTPSGGMVLDRPTYPRMSSFEDSKRNEAGAKSSNDAQSRHQLSGTDAVVVEPSFDDADGRGPSTENRSSAEARSPPSDDQQMPGHSRNLSEHFYESAKISGSDKASASADEASRTVGQKHRRMLSGDVSNPPEAHRRINSIGKVTSILRRPFLGNRQHQRVDSAGLDMLTAAVDASQEELANAAGQRGEARTHSSHESRSSTVRRSPTEVAVYDHGATGLRSSAVQHQRYPSIPPPGYYAPPGYRYPSAFYGPPGYPRTIPGAPPPPPAPPGGYPVQYAHGSNPYATKPEGDTVGRSEVGSGKEGAAGSTADTFGKHGDMTPPAPVPPSHWRGSSSNVLSPSLSTYAPSLHVGEASRTLPSSFQPHVTTERSQAMDSYHHRKSSSISSWVPPLSILMGGPPHEFGEHPLKRHHRTTSSSVSFLGLDVAAFGDGDAAFLKNLHSSNGVAGVPLESKPIAARSTEERGEATGRNEDTGKSKLAAGGTSKRVRRKCNIAGCENRVVQGGLCISHGAKRKQCKHPGCSKNVKKAGLCSTHGPARKRCDAEGCGKVAVQGGRCIAHGAKKKLCCFDGCAKQAILAGMCKKHHDTSRKAAQVNERNVLPGTNAQCQPVNKHSKSIKKPTHTRGLSLFQEMSAETVGTILADGSTESAAPTQHRHQSTFSRDFSNIYPGGS